MKMSLLAMGLALALPAFAQPADRLEGWTHGEATIFTHDPAGPVKVGRVAADGTLVFEWPPAPSTEQTLGQTFVSCREDGQPMARPEAAEFWPTSLFIGKDDSVDGELGSLHLAISPEVVAWQSSHGQADAVEGAWFQFVHVSQAATVEAQCQMPTYTGEGDDHYVQATEYALAFEPGWNLLRHEITSLREAPSGRKHPAALRMSTQPPPAEARWLFRAY